MAINISDVSALRTMTGAGMMDCRNALQEANGDLNQAAEILRKRGIVKAAKRAGKTAAEGLVNVKVEGDAAVIVELNSETDFVAKNEDFKQLLNQLTDFLLAKRPAGIEEALSQTLVNEQLTARDSINNAIAKIGEKISLRRFSIMQKESNEVFGAYIHLGGKIGVMTVLSVGASQELAKDVAMHIAAANPFYLDSNAVPDKVISKEKEIYAEQLKQENKPENIIENIVKGKLNKFYEEVCLLDQLYVKDDKKKIRDVLPAGVSVKNFIRYELGEGIEKESSDFLSTVINCISK